MLTKILASFFFIVNMVPLDLSPPEWDNKAFV